jgi:hypothetical protein
MAAPFRSVGIAVLIGMLCLFASGCTIFVPHVKPEPLPENDPLRYNCAASTSSELTRPPTKPPRKGSVGTPAPDLDAMKKARADSIERAMSSSGGIDPQQVGFSLCEGYIRAEEYRRDYHRAVRWDSGLRTTLNAITIVLAGLAAREGFDPNPSNAKMADFIVGTVVLYGWSSTLTSTPREKVYLNGEEAMSCAMVEAQPIMVGVMQLQPLEAQVAKVKAARAIFDQALEDAGLAPLVNPGDDKYIKLQSDADNAIDRVAGYSRQLAQASGQLLPLIDIIAAQVGRNIVDTEPSNESLQTLIAGFGGQSRGLMTASLPPASPATPKAQSGNIDRVTAEAKVVAPYKALRQQMETLNGMLAKIVEVSEAKTKIGACKAASVVNEFKVEPGDASAVIKVGDVREFKVTNQVSVPTVSIDGEGADSVEKLDTLVRDGAFIVRIKGVKATGETGPTLTIKDGTGQQDKRIALRVAAADTGTGTSSGNNGGADAGAAAAVITDEEKTRLLNKAFVDEVVSEKPQDFLRRSVQALQCVIKAKVDGAVGTDTRTKIAEFMKDVGGRQKPGAIDDALLTKVAAELGAGAADCRKQK